MFQKRTFRYFKRKTKTRSLNLGGIKDLNGKPDLIVIFDVLKDKLRF